MTGRILESTMIDFSRAAESHPSIARNARAAEQENMITELALPVPRPWTPRDAFRL
jgi:hypothetical protein